MRTRRFQEKPAHDQSNASLAFLQTRPFAPHRPLPSSGTMASPKQDTLQPGFNLTDLAIAPTTSPIPASAFSTTPLAKPQTANVPVIPAITHRIASSGVAQPSLIQRDTDGGTPPTTAEVSNARADGPYGWTSSYQVEITDQACTVTIRVRLNPDAGVTPRQVQRVQTQTSTEFARYFDRRFNLRDSSGTVRPLHIQLQYVDSGEHLLVALHPGSGRDNRTNWFVDSAPIDRAHELGHQLGLRDEYVDASVPNRATDASPGVHTDHSLMGNYYAEGMGSADVRQRHGDEIAGDISGATGMNFTAERSNTYIVRPGDNLSHIALRIYGDAAMWRQIYDLNRDRIRDPNLIFPNQELQLPPQP